MSTISSNPLNSASLYPLQHRHSASTAAKKCDSADSAESSAEAAIFTDAPVDSAAESAGGSGIPLAQPDPGPFNTAATNTRITGAMQDVLSAYKALGSKSGSFSDLMAAIRAAITSANPTPPGNGPLVDPTLGNVPPAPDSGTPAAPEVASTTPAPSTASFAPTYAPRKPLNPAQSSTPSHATAAPLDASIPRSLDPSASTSSLPPVSLIIDPRLFTGSLFDSAA